MAANVVSSSQRGGVKGRQIIDNVVDIEGAAISCVSTVRSKHAPAMAFLDMLTAFPSVAHEFIWMVLTAYGVPEFIVHAIHQLHKDNQHNLAFAGAILAGACFTSGVHQGCPLSGIIFAFVLDTPLREIKARLPMHSLSRAFFDDIGLVISKLFIGLPPLLEVLEAFRNIFRCDAEQEENCVHTVMR